MTGFDLKVERMRRGLTQEETSRSSDISIYRLSAFERGRIALRPDELVRLARILTSVEVERP